MYIYKIRIIMQHQILICRLFKRHFLSIPLNILTVVGIVQGLLVFRVHHLTTVFLLVIKIWVTLND